MNEQVSSDTLSLIARARWYVHNFEPRTAQESDEQNALLSDIDMVIPPPPALEFCATGTCVLIKGHPGECCDIPF